MAGVECPNNLEDVTDHDGEDVTDDDDEDPDAPDPSGGSHWSWSDLLKVTMLIWVHFHQGHLRISDLFLISD